MEVIIQVYISKNDQQWGSMELLDNEEAAKWYRKSAEQGNANAQSSLAFMYAKGIGVSQDYKEAANWYQKAAEQGDADAQRKLGELFGQDGNSLQDFVTAYAWYNNASANGDDYAMRLKGIIAKKMTPEQIAKAQELSKEMVKKNPKLINE